MIEQTVAMVDNTSFAAVGRIYYHGDLNVEGGRHANLYYAKYPDARAIDLQSTAEFLTALVLFDQLIWDESSCSQESKEMEDSIEHCPWVYSWFPFFSEAQEKGIINSIDERYTANQRLDLARDLALKWVKERLVQDDYQLPSNFKVPLVYYSPDYESSSYFSDGLEELEFELNERQLAIAMFLHRGIYYQSRAFSNEGWSYLPHTFRACLLDDCGWNVLSLICADEELWLGPPIHKLEITAREILLELDKHFFRELDKAVKIQPILAGSSIGNSFLQLHPKTPKSAVNEALNFRESNAGREIRDHFRDMVNLGRESNKQAINNRLRDMDKLLRNEARRRFGTAWVEDPQATYFLNLLGSWKNIIEPFVGTLPRRCRESITRTLYKSSSRNGFQILFSRYLEPKRYIR